MSESRWPRLMDLSTACKYLSYTRAQFNALVETGLMPRPKEQFPGLKRWHKDALDAATNRLFDIREVHAHEQAEAETDRLIAEHNAGSIRRGHAKRKGADVPVLPSGRQKDQPAAPGGRR